MPNARYNSDQPKNDNASGNAGKRLGNDDGREASNGNSEGKDMGGGVADAKLVINPNEGAPQLPQVGGVTEA